MKNMMEYREVMEDKDSSVFLGWILFNKVKVILSP